MTTVYKKRSMIGAFSLHVLLALFVAGLFASDVAAQAVSRSPTDGTTPLGLTPGAPASAYALSDLDNINLYNGSLNFRLPLIRVGGRGSTGMIVTVSEFERHWRVERAESEGLLSFVPDPIW